MSTHRSTAVEFTVMEFCHLANRQEFMEWCESEGLDRYHTIKLMFHTEGRDIVVQHKEDDEMKQFQHTWTTPPPIRFKDGYRPTTREPL